MFRRKTSINIKKLQKGGNLPSFVDAYLAKFEEKLSNPKLHDCRFVVFDTETTGLNLKKDYVISIGAVGLENLEINVHDSFEVLVQNESSGCKESVPVHRILSKELAKGDPPTLALEKFLKYIDNCVLVAHFAEFDVQMVNKMLKQHFGIPLLNKYIDTIELAKRIERGPLSNMVVHEPGTFNLDNLCKKYNIRITARHNAAGDALATAKLLQRLLIEAKKKGIHHLKDLLRR